MSLRGAVSIARRLQDPLAELVKIEPKSIGVGQYQHDVSETKLAKSLDAVVEDCVNGVGVDLNTASIPLLTRVAGLSETLARNIVGYRDINGAFRSRADLRRSNVWAPKRSNNVRDFCASAAVKTRWMHRPFTRRPINWWNVSARVPTNRWQS